MVVVWKLLFSIKIKDGSKYIRIRYISVLKISHQVVRDSYTVGCGGTRRYFRDVVVNWSYIVYYIVFGGILMIKLCFKPLIENRVILC